MTDVLVVAALVVSGLSVYGAGLAFVAPSMCQWIGAVTDESARAASLFWPVVFLVAWPFGLRAYLRARALARVVDLPQATARGDWEAR